MTPELQYFRERAQVRATTVAVSSTVTQGLSYDPMRYMVALYNSGSIDLSLWFWDTSSPATATFHVPSGASPVVFHEDVLGELVRLPLWIVSATAGPTNISIYTCTYDAARYEQMRRYVRGCLAEYGAL